MNSASGVSGQRHCLGCSSHKSLGFCPGLPGPADIESLRAAYRKEFEDCCQVAKQMLKAVEYPAPIEPLGQPWVEPVKRNTLTQRAYLKRYRDRYISAREFLEGSTDPAAREALARIQQMAAGPGVSQRAYRKAFILEAQTVAGLLEPDGPASSAGLPAQGAPSSSAGLPP